jgi:signal transduction histidine kinase
MAEESYNEVTKMLYRVKDFEQVFNISQGKFRAREEDFLIKRNINDVIEVIKSDVKKKNIDLTFNHGGDLPNMAKADSQKFRQVLLNVLEQTLQGTVKAGVKISTSLHNESGVPHL